MSAPTKPPEIASPVELSLIIPAYNEAQRLPAYLRSVRAYFDRTFSRDYEVIVVDDGSRDGTADLVWAGALDWPQLRCLSLDKNSGKGRALCCGAQSATGKRLLFTDADGATPIEYEAVLREAIDSGAEVATGVRCGSNRTQRRPVRRALSGAFHAASRFLLGTPHRDSQCGFKMMPQATARMLFSLAREKGYLIDLELLMIATRRGLRIAEVPVAFQDLPGSKVHLVRDSCRMLLGLPRLRRMSLHAGD